MAADAPRAVPNASDAEGSLRVPEGRPAPPQSRRPHCGGFSLHLGMLPRGQAPGARGTPGLPRGKGPPAHTKRTRLARGLGRDRARPGLLRGGTLPRQPLPSPQNPRHSATSGLGTRCARCPRRLRRLRVSDTHTCATAHTHSRVMRGARRTLPLAIMPAPLSESEGPGSAPAFPRLRAAPPPPRQHPGPTLAPRTHPRQGLLLVQGGLSLDGGVPGTVGEKGTACRGESRALSGGGQRAPPARETQHRAPCAAPRKLPQRPQCARDAPRALPAGSGILLGLQKDILAQATTWMDPGDAMLSD